MSDFGKSINEKRKSQAIDQMQSLKHQIDLAKERIENFNSEIAAVEFEIRGLKAEILQIYKEHFKEEI